MGVHRAQAGEVVLDGSFVWRVEVPADIDAEYASALRPESCARNVGEKALHAVVVESHAVDQGLGLGQPEQARPGIAGLRPRRDGAAFDETEAQARQPVDVRGVLVHPGRESDRVGEGQAHRAHRRCVHSWSNQLRETRCGRRIQAGEREIVRDFGFESEQQRAEERIEHADRGRAGCEGWAESRWMITFAALGNRTR
jgi:hypothetical protein